MSDVYESLEFRVQRNGVTDRVSVRLNEELDVSNADSIEIVGFEGRIGKK